MAAVIADLRTLAPVPVWLVGTSKGTVSAAFVAGLLRQGGPDGVVLTSSITDRSRETTETVLDADLDEIRVPTLIVHHKQDGCLVTRYNSARLPPGQLKKAPAEGIPRLRGRRLGGGPMRSICLSRLQRYRARGRPRHRDLDQGQVAGASLRDVRPVSRAGRPRRAVNTPRAGTFPLTDQGRVKWPIPA